MYLSDYETSLSAPLEMCHVLSQRATDNTLVEKAFEVSLANFYRTY